MKLTPPPLTIGIDVAADADLVWELLVAVDHWPQWGPSVRRARVDDGGDRIHAGATGRVWTTPGPSLPFAIEQWQGEGPVRRWSWRVAGLSATSHSVRALGAGSRVEMSAPWWAPGYAPILWLGLRRIRDCAQAPRAGGGTTG